LDNCSVKYFIGDNIEDEFNRNLSQIQRYWENRGLPFDTLLKINNKSHKEFVDELKVEVERKLKLDYILEEIARKENINVNEEDIKRQANEEMNKYLSSMPRKR
jgi:FKBP-type peptidyl-prolyl cis-trans isomerase (trigger factor)